MQLETDQVGISRTLFVLGLHPALNNFRFSSSTNQCVLLQHWYALFGFFFTQQTDEQKLEIMQPWTREKVLVEMFDILKNGKDDRLKINLLIFLEENTDFFFSTHPTVYVL